MLSRYHVTLVIASVVGFLSIAAVVTLIVLWLTVLTPFQDYGVVIDAGSSHSTIFVYTWPADKSDGLGTTSVVNQVKVCNVSGGPVSSINIAIQDSVNTYFNSAMTACINQIPSTRQSRALIFLGATAGLRLLNITNPSYTQSLLNDIRTYFRTLGLMFGAPDNQVRIISGSEEGLSGWITANMLMGELFENDQPLETYGVLDMGGASTQMSFIAPNATSENYTMNLFNVDYDVYSHSYLCYGQDQIRLIYQGQLVQQANGTTTIINDPCLQSDYNQTMNYSSINNTACAYQRYVAPAGVTASTSITFVGTGNYTECRTLMLQRFNKSSCSSESNCSFDGVYEPLPISSSLKFIGISAFYSTFTTLAPSVPVSPDSNGNYQFSSTNLTQIYNAIETICDQSWSNVSTNDTKYRPLLCFDSMYHWTLLTYGYSMNDSIKNFQVVNTINSEQIGWTLGYMINQTNYLDPEYRPSRLLTRAEFIGIIICFLVLLVISIILIIISIIILMRRRNSAKKYFS